MRRSYRSWAVLTFGDSYPVLHPDGGETIAAKYLLIATGADYRLLGVEGCEQFGGRGVYYAATPIEAQLCPGSEVVVAVVGNSAGQAADYLAGQDRKVYLVVRGDNPYERMSSYLARRVEDTPNIEVLLNSEVRRPSGEGHLSEAEIINRETGEARKIKTPALFCFIGAVPRTDWLPPEIEEDDKGFVRTGTALAQSSHWIGRRQPFLPETSRPRRVRRRRRAVRLGQARRLGRQ